MLIDLCHFSTRLVVIGLFAFGTSVYGADFTALLPDDTDGVLTVNVKQVLGSAAFKRQFQKQVEGVLQQEPLQSFLKGSDINPLLDIERVTMVIARSGYGPEGHFKEGLTGPMGGPLFIIGFFAFSSG